MNWAEVSALAAVVSISFFILTALFSWLWNHGKRLYGAEVKIAYLEKQQDVHWAEIRAQLVRIETKLDRSIEREIPELNDDGRS